MVNITKPYKYTINGNGHTIDAKRDPSNQGRVINLPSTTNTVVINDVIIKGGIHSTGAAGIYAEARNLVLNNVEITGNKSAGNYGAGILVAGKCEFKSGSVHDNTALGGAGINLYSRGTLILGDSTNTSSCVKIYNNIATESGMAAGCSISARDTGKDFIIYSAKIYDNYNINSGAHVLNNLKLASDVKIKVGGNLSGCTIGVTTENTPSSGSTIPITTGYSIYNDVVPPARIFKSDAGYGVIMDEINGEEAVLAVGGGIIDVPSQIYDDVKIKLDKKVIASKDTSPDKNVIFVSGSLDGESVTLSKLSATLYCHGEEVATYSGNRLTIDMSYPNDTYQLNVTCEYNSKAYSASFDILICDKLNVSMLSAAPESGTYEFSTPAELTKISEFSQSSSLEGVTFELKNDITISGSWTPIGNSTAFKGTLDGCNHKISGLPSGSDALVGTIDGAVIKNLTVAGNSTYAGIIREAKSGNVENCVSEVTVSSTSFAGGVIGKKTGTETVIVKGCTNTGTVTSTFYGDTSAGAGGIVGCSQRNIRIFNSCNTGDVSAPNCAPTINMTPIGAGGIIGNGSGSNNVIISCTNSGKVSSTGYTGGITGNGGKIANCINYGQITGGTFTGGISGGDWTSSGDGYVYIVNCFNIGSVTSNSTDSGHGIGALIGRMRCDGGFGQAIYIIKSFAFSETAVDLIGKYESGTREDNNFVSEEGYSGMIDTLNTFVNTDNKGNPIYNDYKDQFKHWTIKDGKPALVD